MRFLLYLALVFVPSLALAQKPGASRIGGFTSPDGLEKMDCPLPGSLHQQNMGIDLQVLASHFRERRGELLATASLRFDRDQRLLAQFSIDAEPCLVRPLPKGLKVGHYEDDGLKFDDVDRYGKPLTFTTPADLQNLRPPDDLCPWNRAILAFLESLPPDTRLVLFWC